MTDMYTITFTDKKSQYTRNEIIDIEFINDMLNSEEFVTTGLLSSNALESKTRKFDLPCPQISFDYLIGRISKTDIAVIDYSSLIDGIVSLADYTVDIPIMIVAYELLNDIDIMENTHISEIELVSKYDNFFVYPLYLDKDSPLLAVYKKFIRTYICLGTNMTAALVPYLNRSQLLTICQFYNHGRLHEIVRFVNTWNTYHYKDESISKWGFECASKPQCWEDINKLNLRFSLTSKTFKKIKKINVNLLLVPFINSYLDELDIDKGACITSFRWKPNEDIYHNAGKFIVRIINNVIHIEAIANVWHLVITDMTVEEGGTLRAGHLMTGKKFTYHPAIISEENLYTIGWDRPQ